MRRQRIATVTLSWNGGKDLEEVLASLARQSVKPGEVVVVDSGSTDGTQQMIRKKYPSVKLHELGTNLGITKGFNIAFSKVSRDTDIVVVVDQDVSIARDFIRTCAEKFSSLPASVAVLAGDVQEPNRASLNVEEGRVSDFHGSCFAYRNMHRQHFRYCEEFFGYNNESDLAARLLDRGLGIYFYPKWKVFHKKDTTVATPLRTFYSTRNIIWHFWRNGRLIDAVIGPLVIMAVYYSWASRSDTLREYFRGIAHAFLGLPFCVRTRKPTPYASYRSIHDVKVLLARLRRI